MERPLRLNFQASAERIARLDEERAFENLAKSKRKDPERRAAEVEAGREEQARLRSVLESMPDDPFRDRKAFRKTLKATAKGAGVKLAAPIRKAIESALSERDEDAAVCVDKYGDPEPDKELRDYENVPLDEDVRAYFEREVVPYVPDAWIDETYRDDLDGAVGRVGYEINFNRYFYVYEPPRPLEEITAEIREVEREIVALLGDVAGGAT